MSNQPATPLSFTKSRSPTVSLRLFCLPYAGGGARIFWRWPQQLPRTIEVCPIELPGRGSRMQEPPLTNLLALVRDMAYSIRPNLDRPFALFGHSMGALLGFELARLLRREEGVGPVGLFVSGCGAPQIHYGGLPTYDLPDSELLEELRCLNGTPKEVLDNPELMQLMLPLLRADFEMIETYTYFPEPPLDCPISAFGGLRDPKTKLEHLVPWRDQTTARFTLRMLNGDHFFLHQAEPQLLYALLRELPV